MTPQAAELHVFGRFHARPGCEGDVATALREVVEATRLEPGCLAIESFRATRDATLFFIHSRWRDAGVFEVHAQLPHTRAFLASIAPLLTHEHDVTRTTRIESV
jgi:quinol monooxygenase YgiN